MGNPFKSEVPEFPLRFALMLRDWCACRVFVETGTYQGDTAKLVSPYFYMVLTVEGVYERFLALHGVEMPGNVIRYFGDSGVWLERTLPDIDIKPFGKLPCLIFLDAHWIHAGMDVGEDTYQDGLSVCPLRGELEAIDMSVPHVILIDDAHFFTHPPKNRGNDDEWLSLDQIIQLLPGRYVFIHEGMICAVPEVYRSDIREWLKVNWRDADRIPACHSSSNV